MPGGGCEARGRHRQHLQRRPRAASPARASPTPRRPPAPRSSRPTAGASSPPPSPAWRAASRCTRSCSASTASSTSPWPSTTALSRATLGMKNWMGVLGRGRNRLHQDIDRAAAELGALFRPTLTVVDATRVLLANGPQGGSLGDVRKVDAVAAGLDPVALRRVGGDADGPRPAFARLHPRGRAARPRPRRREAGQGARRVKSRPAPGSEGGVAGRSEPDRTAARSVPGATLQTDPVPSDPGQPRHDLTPTRPGRLAGVLPAAVPVPAGAPRGRGRARLPVHGVPPRRPAVGRRHRARRRDAARRAGLGAGDHRADARLRPGVLRLGLPARDAAAARLVAVLAALAAARA